MNLRNMLSDRIHNIPLILDIGTGTGSSLDLFPDNTLIVAVDQSIHMLQQSRKCRTGLSLVVANINDLPFKSSCVFFSSCIGVTEYIKDVDHFVGEMKRMLTDAGILLITGARPCLFNYLRFLLGHRLYLRKQAIWDRLIKIQNFACLNYRASWLQMQWLLKNNENQENDRFYGIL